MPTTRSRCTTTLYIHVNPLTCVVVVLFLSFLFKVFAVYYGKRGKSRKGHFRNYMYMYAYDIQYSTSEAMSKNGKGSS